MSTTKAVTLPRTNRWSRLLIAAAAAFLSIQAAAPGARLVHESQHASTSLASRPAIDGVSALSVGFEAGSRGSEHEDERDAHDGDCSFCAALVQVRNAATTSAFAPNPNDTDVRRLLPTDAVTQSNADGTTENSRAPPALHL